MNASVNAVSTTKVAKFVQPIARTHEVINILANNGDNIELFLRSNYSTGQPELKEEELVRISVEELGFPRGATLKLIFDLANEKGLKLIEKENVLRLVGFTKLTGIIATLPEITNHSQFVLFRLDHHNKENALLLCRGGYRNFFEPQQVFIFKRNL